MPFMRLSVRPTGQFARCDLTRVEDRLMMNRVKVCVPECKCGRVAAFPCLWFCGCTAHCHCVSCYCSLHHGTTHVLHSLQSFSVCSARRRLATADATSIPSLRAMVSTAIAMDKTEFCLLLNPPHTSPLSTHTVCVGREAAYLAVH
jgi:hypothetical protein